MRQNVLSCDLKALFAWICLLFLASVEAHGQFYDDYSDGDLINDPAWLGDTAQFRVDPQGRLQQVAPPASGSAMLYTHSRAIFQADWTWWMRLGFNPSGSNYADVYVLSQSPRLDSALSGYFVRVGSTADDVCLYRQTGSTRTCIINGRDGVLNRNDNPLRVRVTRDSIGIWSLYTDTTGSGLNWHLEGTAYDAMHHYGLFTGCRQVFSSTRSQLYWYDDWDVRGMALPDTLRPQLLMARLARQGVIKLEFNKGFPPGLFLQPQQYALSGFGIPTEVEPVGARSIELRWSMTLPDEGSFRLCLMLIDSGGVPLDTCAEWVHVPNSRGDLIFNEIMFVPPLSGPLPPTEYIELRNMSLFPLELGDWVYGDRSSSVVLPAYRIPVGGYLVLCPPGTDGAWLGIAPALALPSWPTLNNDGDELYLRHPEGWLADTLAYQTDWHASPIKKLGGWSLERRNGHLDCPDSWNWSSSIRMGVLLGESTASMALIGGNLAQKHRPKHSCCMPFCLQTAAFFSNFRKRYGLDKPLWMECRFQSRPVQYRACTGSFPVGLYPLTQVFRGLDWKAGPIVAILRFWRCPGPCRWASMLLLRRSTSMRFTTARLSVALHIMS